MIVNIPLNSSQTNEVETQQYNQHYEIKEYRENNLNNMTNTSMSPVPKWSDIYSPSKTIMSNITMMSNTMMGQSLKSQTNKQLPCVPLLKSVDNNEMDTVPKYEHNIITRLNTNILLL